MKSYHLRSNQPDRIAFDEMLGRLLEAALNALDDKTALHYATEDPQTFINVQWDAESDWMTDESEGYAEDMGKTYVEDIKEAEARFYSVGRDVLKSYAREYA